MTAGAWEAATPLPGVHIAQPARGYRYTSEAFWLAGAALGSAPRRALDLGTGSGVVPLLLAAHGVVAHGVDRLADWAPLWAASVEASRLAAAVQLRVADVRDPVGATYDVVTANPPFFPRGTGPVSADPWRAAGRWESGATLADFVRAAWAAVRPGGWIWLAVPSARASEVLAVLAGVRGEATVVLPAPGRAVVGVRRGGEATDAVVDGAAGVAAGVCWYAAVGASMAGGRR